MPSYIEFGTGSILYSTMTDMSGVPGFLEQVGTRYIFDESGDDNGINNVANAVNTCFTNSITLTEPTEFGDPRELLVFTTFDHLVCQFSTVTDINDPSIKYYICILSTTPLIQTGIRS